MPSKKRIASTKQKLDTSKKFKVDKLADVVTTLAEKLVSIEQKLESASKSNAMPSNKQSSATQGNLEQEDTDELTIDDL